MGKLRGQEEAGELRPMTAEGKRANPKNKRTGKRTTLETKSQSRVTNPDTYISQVDKLSGQIRQGMIGSEGDCDKL